MLCLASLELQIKLCFELQYILPVHMAMLPMRWLWRSLTLQHKLFQIISNDMQLFGQNLYTGIKFRSYEVNQKYFFVI